MVYELLNEQFSVVEFFFSQAVKVNDIVYLSGVIGMDKETNKLVTGSVEVEARQVMTNMRNILQAAGSGMDKRKHMQVILIFLNETY